MVCPFFQNNKVDFFSLSHMLWGDTIQNFGEGLGRFDCTDLAKIEFKIPQMANLFLIYFPSKVSF